MTIWDAILDNALDGGAVVMAFEANVVFVLPAGRILSRADATPMMAPAMTPETVVAATH